MGFIEHLEGLIVSKYAVAKGLFTLFKLEAKLAGLNVVPFLIMLGAFIALCFSAWLTLMILLGYLILLLVGPLMAMILMLVLNIVALIFVVKSLTSCVRQMSFEKTRALLTKYQSKDGYELTKRNTEFH
ncbi:Uncharacterised protein [Legionella lansingensis]|uniref:Uncharacterized protein n=1 Tax=Legionella lansingensis TaxID=45067 RepID=A0A0W0VIM0_9GAMM|nr:hypothetical protein [Legionella lansingensis]KTD19951.1 hypothetical protein Llan_2046 [Legionella lansingensis]SNV48549.1 Uncharacterised protein [Legionella lansingensis]